MSLASHARFALYDLERKGSRITGGGNTWQMMGVHGPFDPGALGFPPTEQREGIQFFKIETSIHETLLVYRPPGERGMRRLFLLEVNSRSA